MCFVSNRDSVAYQVRWSCRCLEANRSGCTRCTVSTCHDTRADINVRVGYSTVSIICSRAHIDYEVQLTRMLHFCELNRMLVSVTVILLIVLCSSVPNSIANVHV